jgi:CRP-like cAMP-binding protein
MSESAQDALARSPLLRFIPAEHHERLRAGCISEHHAFGEVIVRQGDPADAFYLLVSGRARVIKTSASGEELALNRLTPGDEFGEAALLDGGTRSAERARQHDGGSAAPGSHAFSRAGERGAGPARVAAAARALAHAARLSLRIQQLRATAGAGADGP